MADSKISQLTNYTTPVSADVLPIVDTANTITKKVTIANLFNILSSLFTIKDSSDTTKKLAFDVSGITTATTRTVTVPDANLTMVGIATTQTLTNKTLGNPTKINTSGSDPTGSMYYRDASGNLQPVSGTTNQIISLDSSNLPTFIPNPAAADATFTVKGVKVLDADSGYYAADSGSTDAYAITLSPALNAYADGQTFRFKANTINTGTATLNINGLGAKTIVKGVNTTLSDGDIQAGQICEVTYNGTNFVLNSPTGNSSAGTSYVGAATSTGTISSTQNVDTTFTTNFLPKNITIYYTLQGNNSGDKYTTGIATFNGTTLTGVMRFLQDGTSSGAFTQATTAINSTAITAGDASGGILVTLSVLSVSSTNCVIRVAFNHASASGSATFYPVITG